MNKIRYLFPILVVLILSNINVVYAQNNDQNMIEINYYSDIDHSKPINGSVWRLYKVADVNTNIVDGNLNSYDIKPLVDEFNIDNINSHLLLSNIKHKKIDESTLDITSITNSGVNLTYYEKHTDKNGILKFENLENGVYLGVEIKAARNHLLSEPFVVTVPFTKETLTPNRQVIFPKAITANDLVITKKVSGNLVSEDDVFQVKVYMPKGRYKMQYQNGDVDYISNGDSVFVSHKNNVTIFDVQANEEYTVKEVVANKLGFKTTYTNNKGTINANEATVCTINNHRHLNELIDTSDVGTIFISLGSGVALVGIGTYIFIRNRKE